MKSIRILPWIFVSAACMGLVACGGLLSSDSAVERTYWLQPYTAQQPPVPAQERRGLVVRFSVVPGLDSDRLLTLGTDAELNHIAGAHWPDHLPEFAGSLIRRSVQSAGLFTKVSSERESGQQDCELDLQALKFYTLLDRAGVASSVQISISGQYKCQDLLQPVVLDVNVHVTQNQVTGVVAAHQQAMDSLMHSLLRQLDVFMSGQ